MIVGRVPHPRTSAEASAGEVVKGPIWTTRANGSAIDTDIYGAKTFAFAKRRTSSSPLDASPQRRR